jgi:ribosomal protein S27E
MVFMPARPSLVVTCPDCGGILQPVGRPQLTSAEVATADEAGERLQHVQCLICGYGEDRVVSDEEDEVAPA